MARYIDVNFFAERIKLSPAFRKMGHEGYLLQSVVLDLLDAAPTADVVEVKHGCWIDNIEKATTVAGVTKEYMIGYRCSLCGRQELAKEPYCNCGAKMNSQ